MKPSQKAQQEYRHRVAPKRAREINLQWYKDRAVEDGKQRIANWGKRILQPGKIYIFDYDPVTKEELEWYDRNPMVLSLGLLQREGRWRKLLDLGINLHFIPLEMRKVLLDRIYDLNKSIIENEIRSNLRVTADRQQHLRNVDYHGIKNFLKTNGFDFAIRSYYRQKRRDVFVIPYEDWYRTLYLRQEDIIGTSIQNIYRAFHRKRRG